LENREFMKKLSVLSVFALLFVLISSIFIFNSKTEAYSSKVTHPILTQKIAELYNYVYEPDLTDEEIQLLMDGSKKEDTAPRWINHFYDPNTGLGWFGKRLGDISQEDVMTAAILAFGKEPVSIIDWAQDQDLQNSQYSLYQGNRTFDSAVLYSIEGNEQEAYYSLGYVLHLVEDMAVPAHTRQDTHFDMAPDIFEQILDIKLDKGEPYEKWAEENGEISQDTIDDLKNNYQSICSSLESCLINLANYSNKDFFSQDSILDKEYFNPVITRYVISDNKAYAYGKNNILLFMADVDPVTYEQTSIIMDNQVYWDYLSPAAILAGVEVVKYFHGQTEKAKNNEITLIRPAKLSFLKRIQTISTYGEFARLWKLASLASINPFSLFWGDNNQQDETQPISQSPSILNDLGLTYGEAQERMDDLQELLDLLNNKEGGDSFDWPTFELPSLPSIEPPSLELPSLENPLELPPLLQTPPQNQPQPPVVITYAGSESGGGNVAPIIYPKILISEIQILPTEARFIEIYNPNSSEVNLTDWYIQRKTATGSDWNSFVSSIKFEGKIIPAKSYFLISRQIGNSDITSDITLSDNNSLILKNPNREVVDKIGWGQTQEFESAPTINPSSGKSIGRKWVSNTEQDTDSNLIDFESQDSTPKAKNSSFLSLPPPPPPSPPSPTTDTVAPTVVFSLNPTQETINFSINFETTDLSVENVSPSGLTEFQFQWKEEGKEWQIDTPQTIIGASTVYLGIRDFIGQDEKKYYFQIKAKDVNNNESVWLPETPAETKISVPKTILINEIQTEGKTTKDEFIELYNPNNVDVNLLEFSLKKKTSGGTESNLISSGSFSGIIPALGYFLIAPQINNDGTLNYMGLETPDLYYSGKTYSVAFDNTILLYDNYGNLLDKVGFGSAKDFETNPTLNPPEAGSIGRKGMGQDTNNNSVDFSVYTEPTPKESSLKTYIQSDGYSDCWSSGECGLNIKWRSPSQNIDFYQVQYKLNDGDWSDWLSQTTDKEGTFRASSIIIADHIYYFKARVKDLEGNIGNWSEELKIDFSIPVVINEVALFGTNASRDDQWIELYNKSDKDVDLNGWRLRGGRDTYEKFTLILQGIIPAKGYMILERTDDQVISDLTSNQVFSEEVPNTYGNFYLENEKGRKIDSFYMPGWPGWFESSFLQGENYYSIERISPYSFGYDYRNWIINDGQKINSHDRDKNLIYGTPGQQNSNCQLYTLLSTNFSEDVVLLKSVDGMTTGPYILIGNLNVFEGVTLTIEPGVRIEAWTDINNSLIVSGTLKAIGTPEDPIVFTAYNPDNQPENPGGWLGLLFKKESTDSELENVLVKNAGGHCSLYGGDFCAGIKVNQTSISIKNSVIENNMVSGLRLVNSNSIIDSVQILNHQFGGSFDLINGKGIQIEGGSPIIKNSYINDNQYGIYTSKWHNPDTMVEMPATPTIENNTFERNSYPIWLGELVSPSLANNQFIDNENDGIVIVGNIGADTTWAATGLSYIIKSNLSVLPGVVLTIQPGVTVKLSSSALTIQGTLKAIGTGDDPIIFTSIYDPPNPGQWKELYFTETSQNSELEYIQLRYGTGIKVNQSGVSLKNSVIEKNINRGLWLINSPSIIDSVNILDNIGTTYNPTGYGKGIEVQGGSPTIIDSNITGNYYGLYLSDWYDEVNEITVPATPIIENTDYSVNSIPIWPLP